MPQPFQCRWVVCGDAPQRRASVHLQTFGAGIQLLLPNAAAYGAVPVTERRLGALGSAAGAGEHFRRDRDPVELCPQGGSLLAQGVVACDRRNPGITCLAVQSAACNELIHANSLLSSVILSNFKSHFNHHSAPDRLVTTVARIPTAQPNRHRPDKDKSKAARDDAFGFLPDILFIHHVPALLYGSAQHGVLLSLIWAYYSTSSRASGDERRWIDAVREGVSWSRKLSEKICANENHLALKIWYTMLHRKRQGFLTMQKTRKRHVQLPFAAGAAVGGLWPSVSDSCTPPPAFSRVR